MPIRLPLPHHIQNGHIHIVVGAHIGDRILPQGKLHRLISGPLQIDDHKAADIVLIFQNQYFFIHNQLKTSEAHSFVIA